MTLVCAHFRPGGGSGPCTRRILVGYHRASGGVATAPTMLFMSKPLGPYTPAVRAGDWVIVSGQLGVKDGVLVPGGVAAQTAQAVQNLAEQLASMGASLADVAKTLCFLTDMDTFAAFNEAYVAGFGQSRPARSTVGVAALPQNGAVEIEAWAYRPA